MSNTKLSICLISGLMFLWPFSRANYFGEFIFDSTSSRSAATIFYLIFIICVFAVCLVVLNAKITKRLNGKSHEIIIFVAISGFVGCGLILMTSILERSAFSMALRITGIALWAIEVFTLVAIWMQILTHISTKQLMQVTILSLGASFFLMWFLGALPDMPKNILKACFASASAFFCWHCLKQTEQMQPEYVDIDEGSLKQGAYLQGVYLLVGSILTGYYYADGGLGFLEPDLSFYRIVSIALATGVTIMAFIARRPIRFLVVARITIRSLFVAAFIFILILPAEFIYIAEGIVVSSRVFIIWLFLISMLFLIRTKEISVVLGIVIYLFMQALAGVVPYCLLPYLVYDVGIDIKVIIGISISAIILALAIQQYKEKYYGDITNQVTDISRSQACAAIRKKYHLTERETEVLLELSQGHTRSAIASELFVSESTVAAHTRSIYAKTDRHTKEEIINLVNDRIVGRG